MTQQNYHIEEPKRAALYARISQLNPLGGMEPLQVQVERCTAYCLEHGFIVSHDQHYAEEQEGSAGSHRPALARLGEAVRQRVVAVAVVSSPSRLTRDLALSAILGEKFKAAGITIATVEA